MNGTAIEECLSDMRKGDAAVVDSLAASQALAKRLADMGFVRGAIVEMIRPGRPCLVRIGATCVGLGAEHQRSIIIRTSQDQPCR